MNTKPAFPTPFIPGKDVCDNIPAQQGMSLREWYAGLAMQSMLGRQHYLEYAFKQAGEDLPAFLAKDAFSLADTMIEESQKQQK